MTNVVGLASRQGTREYNMDAAAVFETADGTIAVAVVDGIGNDKVAASLMQLIADTAVRVAVARGPLAGVLTAAALIAPLPAAGIAPDAVMVLAVRRPGAVTELAWVGDSHIYGIAGLQMARRSDAHTMGQYLRRNGENEQLAVRHDNWVRITLATATATTVALAEAPAGETLVLLSDGLDQLPPGTLHEIVTRDPVDPQGAADELVGQVVEDGDGYRDDATVVVLAGETGTETEG